MDAVSLLILFVAKTFLLALPFAVAWLSFRRLTLSATSNGWIYAVSGLLASFSAAGVAPWALGFGGPSWPFMVLAVLCPPLWLGVVTICGSGRGTSYELSSTEADPTGSLSTIADKARDPAVLVLENPHWPKSETPVFRHRAPSVHANANSGPLSRTSQRILDVARDMRLNPDSRARRRPLLLPPPRKMSQVSDLPFLRSGS